MEYAGALPLSKHKRNTEIDWEKCIICQDHLPLENDPGKQKLSISSKIGLDKLVESLRIREKYNDTGFIDCIDRLKNVDLYIFEDYIR